MDQDFKWYSENEDKFNINNKGGVVFLTSPLFDRITWLNSGISTRIGGVSEGFYSSMNLGYATKDNPEKVYKNYQIFCDATGIDINKIVRPKQVHDNKVINIDSSHIFRSIKLQDADYPDVDGMITNIKDVTLFSYSADCSIIMIVDPINKAIGQCHSGWRGTAKKISEVTINMMKDTFGSKPEDLLVTVCPSICQDCFEVEWDMISEAIKSFPESIHEKIYYKKNDTKYQFNLWEANKFVIINSGVKEDNIFMPNLCTKCNSKLLFSHREMGLKRGTLAAFLSIKE